jgi:DmsE family decaheme c-type cytochrome
MTGPLRRRWRTLSLVACTLLWIGAIGARSSAFMTEGQQPTVQAQPATPPDQTTKPAPPKKNRFDNVVDDDDDKPAAPAQKKSRFAMTDEQEEKPQADPNASPYIGTDRCVKCHAKQARQYFAGPHGRTWDERTPARDIGCETCHGPGRAHDLEPGTKGLIRMFTRIPPREATKQCMTCHYKSQHALWQGSMHDARNVTCVGCHSVHSAKSERNHLKGATVTDTCAQCHRDKAAKMQRSGHMPVREGKMECSSCHDPHGTPNVRLLRGSSTINEACLRCHTEKRGPFLWEHAPVAEKCTTCHDPHGSSNSRMLVTKETMLCQRCHISTRHPATPYDGAALASRSDRLIGRGCVNCHQLVHGSNHPSGQWFQR